MDDFNFGLSEALNWVLPFSVVYLTSHSPKFQQIARSARTLTLFWLSQKMVVKRHVFVMGLYKGSLSISPSCQLNIILLVILLLSDTFLFTFFRVVMCCRRYRRRSPSRGRSSTKYRSPSPSHSHSRSPSGSRSHTHSRSPYSSSRSLSRSTSPR